MIEIISPYIGMTMLVIFVLFLVVGNEFGKKLRSNKKTKNHH